MPPSTPSFLLSRSLSSNHVSHPVPSPSTFEHINISSVDTPTHSLRSEILIGFGPLFPYSLLTLSRPQKSDHDLSTTNSACELGIWEFHPQRQVALLRRLGVREQPDYLPVAVAATGFSVARERYFQVIYRCATDDGEGCIEVRCLPVDNSVSKWSVWESVTEEDGLLGGICWNLLGANCGGCGYITVAMASRVYFFTEDVLGRDGKQEEEHWTFGRKCLIFEVDVFLQRQVSTTQPTRYATRLIHSSSSPTISVLVFTSQKSQLQSFKLEISPADRKVVVCAKTELVQWKSGARGALIAWSMGRKLMTAHCCEDECAESRDETRISVFKTWFARGDKRSLKQLVWEYGGVIVDCWDP